jgi:hypothetical protein
MARTASPYLRRTARRSVAWGATLLAWGAIAAPVLASEPDWAALSDVGVIEIVTEDEDGDLRETKVWFVLVDGIAYLRTNGSRWLENIHRDPNLVVRIGDEEYAQVAREVTTPTMIERVDEASREKYGWQEAVIHAFRFSDPQILELSDPES